MFYFHTHDPIEFSIVHLQYEQMGLNGKIKRSRKEKKLQRKQNRTRARVNTLETFNKTMNTMNFSAKGECLFRFYQFFSLRKCSYKIFWFI